MEYNLPSFPYIRMDKKIVIDIRSFTPCNPKKVEEWSWKKAKNEKWIVHVMHDGRINKK